SMREPAALERLNADAAIPVGSTPAEFAAFIARERERWKPVIARAKVKPD
ncbi:MAG: tripartite tricarboxylate transporter substrate binding protein, partial [Caldimonas sp.]